MNKVVELMKTAKNIAVVGISDNPERPSYRVAAYLKSKGYKIIPVNPKYGSVLGEKCYPDLKSVPDKIDIVDVFRKSEDVPPVAEAAKDLGIKCFWMQLDIKSEEAKSILEEKGITVVEDVCIKIFHASHEKEIAAG